MKRDGTRLMTEDAEHTLIYVDILGFGKLTKDNPYRIVHGSPNEDRFTSSETGPIQNQIIRFHNVIDMCVSNCILSGDLQAMLFSDCIYLDAGDSLRAALIATEIMRNCILKRVPVRIGIGRGTFYPLTFSSEITGETVISRSRFVGTAVVFAHEAEQCGGKGMRIFVHPSVEQDRRLIEGRVELLALPKQFKDARWELNYLHERQPARQEPTADRADRDLFDAVTEMKSPAEPLRIRRHYIDTLKAMNRMRKANSRMPVDIRTRKR
jgi:hypothetical protein